MRRLISVECPVICGMSRLNPMECLVELWDDLSIAGKEKKALKSQALGG